MAVAKEFVVKPPGLVVQGNTLVQQQTTTNTLVVTTNTTTNNLTVLSILTVNTVNASIIVTSNVTANQANVNVIRANTANIDNLSVNTGAFVNVSVNVGNVVSLTSNTANVNVAGITNATVNSLTVGTLTVTGNSSLAFERGSLLRSYREYVAVINATGTSVSLDLLDSNIFRINLSANTTFTLNNVPAANIATSFTMVIKRTNTNMVVTFPANTVWSEGIVPVQSTGNNQIDVFTFTVFDAGALIIGAHSFANVS
jgi:hypothetical protein